MEEIECVVSGRVQMVMYRDFAKRHARRRAIVGTVQNLPDGTVRIVAQGSRINLGLFIEDLKKGPLLADVKEVRAMWRKPTTTYDGFSIVY